LRILYLNASAQLGGAERVLLEALRAGRAGHKCFEPLLIVPGPGPLVARAQALGARVSVLPFPPALAELGDSSLRGRSRWHASLTLAGSGPAAGWTAFRYAAELGDLARRLRPQLIHSNSLKFHLLTRLARIRRTPVVWHVHDFLSARPWMARLLRWGQRRASALIAVSHAVARDAHYALRGRSAEVIHNAVDTSHFTPARAEGAQLDQLAGLPPAPPNTARIGLVATYARWKGHDVFLEAVARLVRAFPGQPARFYVIGGPIYETRGSQWSLDDLQRQASVLQVSQQVGFIPFQADPVDIYRALDIVVHASTQPEPFGLTIVEAMACGRAVIVSHTGGARELITHDQDAVGVAPGDPEALAQAMARLLSAPELRWRLGNNARRTACERFSCPRFGGELLAVYGRAQSSRREVGGREPASLTKGAVDS
jgi:glycosyltransferase involved in cell wall biosynthesis